MSLTYIDKTAGASVPAVLDFSQFFLGAPLASAVWSAPAGVAVSGQSITAGVASASLSGGTAGSDYLVSVVGADASGKSATINVVLRVRASMDARTSDLDAIVSLVAPTVPSAPLDTIRTKIIESASEFCQKSGVWVERLTGTVTVAGQPSYELAIPDQSVIEGVTDAWCNGAYLTPILIGEARSCLSSGPPKNYAHDDSRLWLAPAPSVANLPIVAIATLSPSLDATRIPSFLTQRHRVAIAEGAKSRLMFMPGTSWTNPQDAQIARIAFDESASSASRTATVGRSPGSMRVRPRRFG